MERTILRAEPGFLLTDGQVPGKVIYLAHWDKAENYRQIPEEEYNAAFEDQATPEDYEAALREMGVGV